MILEPIRVDDSKAVPTTPMGTRCAGSNVSEWWGAVLSMTKALLTSSVESESGAHFKEHWQAKDWGTGGGVGKGMNLIADQRSTTMGNFDNELIIHWRRRALEKKGAG